jgi:quercetin dioxygenase-like cupin family protein
MKKYKLFTVFVFISVFSALAFTFVQTHSLKPKIVFPVDIKWTAAQSGGMETTVLEGDPQKEGFYVMRVKIPKGMKLLPHFHPEDRTAVILSGTFYYSYGEKFDESKLHEMPTGTFFTEPSKQPHFAWAKAGEVIIHVTGVGPTGTTYVDAEKK